MGALLVHPDGKSIPAICFVFFPSPFPSFLPSFLYMFYDMFYELVDLLEDVVNGSFCAYDDCSR